MRPFAESRSESIETVPEAPHFSSSSDPITSPARLDEPDSLTDDRLAYPAVSSFAPTMNFRVDLDIFRGPLDLLLYLVRKHELDVMDIPIALITEQYLGFLQVLEQLDVNSVGDFIELASHLIEIKSRLVLPRVEEDEQPLDDPRDELVQRLLEYKKYKDAASMLEESSHSWQQRYTRLANDLPPRTVDPSDQPIHEVELWDMVNSIGRIMRQSERAEPPTIVYDDTPIQVHMQELHDRLVREGRIAFSCMFRAGMQKATLIGVFLAILELVRNFNVVVQQDDLHGEIWLTQGPDFKPTLEVSELSSDFESVDLAIPGKPR